MLNIPSEAHSSNSYTSEIEAIYFRCQSKDCEEVGRLNKVGPFCYKCGGRSKEQLVIEIHHFEYINSPISIPSPMPPQFGGWPVTSTGTVPPPSYTIGDPVIPSVTASSLNSSMKGNS